MSYVPDKQTNKQTDSKILPSPTDIVDVGSNAGSGVRLAPVDV